jgi:hypothetical protein
MTPMSGNFGRGSVILTRRHFRKPRRCSFVLTVAIVSWFGRGSGFSWPELDLNFLRGFAGLISPQSPVGFFLLGTQSGRAVPDFKKPTFKLTVQFGNKHIPHRVTSTKKPVEPVLLQAHGESPAPPNENLISRGEQVQDMPLPVAPKHPLSEAVQ